MQLEQLVLNLFSIVVGVFFGTWLGTELMSRRISKTARKILKKILEDDETKETLEKAARSLVIHMIKTVKEEFYTQPDEDVDEEDAVVELPKPTQFRKKD